MSLKWEVIQRKIEVYPHRPFTVNAIFTNKEECSKCGYIKSIEDKMLGYIICEDKYYCMYTGDGEYARSFGTVSKTLKEAKKKMEDEFKER